MLTGDNEALYQQPGNIFSDFLLKSETSVWIDIVIPVLRLCLKNGLNSVLNVLDLQIYGYNLK
jgi:hypothetical protein